MSLTLKNNADANQTYNLLRDSSVGTQLNKSYYGPLHSDVLKDLVVVKSTDPKRTADSYGVRRSVISYYVTKPVQGPTVGTMNKDLKVEVSVSFPIGAGSSVVSAADFHEACARLQAFLSSEAMMDAVCMLGVSPD